MANHTWSHPDISLLDSRDVADEINRNASFLMDTYGVDGRPFFRPPFGSHNDDTDRIAADLGYSIVTLWSSSLDDWKVLDDSTFISNADRCFEPGEIVLGHANEPTVTRCFGRLAEIIDQRSLQTVTLNDVTE